MLPLPPWPAAEEDVSSAALADSMTDSVVGSFKHHGLTAGGCGVAPPNGMGMGGLLGESQLSLGLGLKFGGLGAGGDVQAFVQVRVWLLH